MVRVLCVDDEPEILAGYSSLLRQRFEIVTATSGQAGLEVLGTQGPFMAVVSDFTMPGMNGAQFLSRCRTLAPNTIRILLTGHASLEGAIAAVNEGNIFRFLTKPCSASSLRGALEDASEQARLITADKELLERKLDAMSSHLLRAERLATLGTMAGAVGHELNNVLTVFGNALHFIREEAAAGRPATQEDIDSLEHVGKHLGSHAKNLLHLGRTNHQATGRCNFNKAVTDAVGLLRSGGIFRNGEVDVRLPPQDTMIPLDATEIEQVLVNLVKNAVDAVREKRGTPHIAVDVALSGEGREVSCAIRDNGPGIAKEHLAQIFEPYFTTKPAETGTGLGLFVVKKIIERAGGRINVVSELGAGATFTFVLPVGASA